MNRIMSFKEYILERTNIEISKDVLRIEDQSTLNKIDSVLSAKIFEQKLDKIFEGKQIPTKSKNSIKSFFESHKASIEDKISLLNALEEGIITSVEAGYYQGIDDLTDHSVKALRIFDDFVEYVGALGDAKDGQGATGTGKGEILMAMLAVDGFLPNKKGDIDILGKALEVKASNGAVALFKAYKDIDETNEILQKYFDDAELSENNLKGLVQVLNKQKDKRNVKKFLIQYFEDRAEDKFVKKNIKAAVEKIDLKNLTNKSVQTAFGEVLLSAYKEDHGWDGIMIFKESKQFMKSPLSIAYTKSEFERYVNFIGLNMSNGTRPAVLAVSPKRK
jgi:hypothetical protein